jgi:tRNA(fMet)-specific endonuclease VapC
MAESYKKIVEQCINQLTILPIFDSISFYGKEKSRLRKEGKMISDFDLLIGYTVVDNEWIMLTQNVREFERISEIKTENWIKR